MRVIHRLSAAQVKNAEPGKYADGGGLWLHKREDGGAQWVLRVTVHGRRREMGLGRLADVSLKDAREAANEWRALARQGTDPIKERERRRRQAAKEDHTLAQIAQDTFEARKAELKRDGKAGRWFSPLELHVLPKIGKVPVEELDQRDIRDTLAPIWHTKPDPARKAMNRLGLCLKHAAALGLDVDLQATEKARALLGKQRHKVKHVPAVPWQEVPTFYATLSDGTITHLALRFLILTAARSGEVRFCCEDEIDGETWVIPASRTKTGKEHRIPLSKEAQAVLEEAGPLARGGYFFPSVRSGVISDATMSRHMERRGMEERPHGFRSSFRDWCAEATNTSREVAEAALGHMTGGSVERAYRRTDFLEQRRVLMERWANHMISGTGQVARLASI